jgi:2-oxoglutarate ferredoxin oxidoreductase subunit delta
MSIYIDERICKGCGICVYFCPQDVLRMSEQRNEKGYVVAEIVDPEECNSCKMCEINCPDFAIYVVKEAKSSG